MKLYDTGDTYYVFDDGADSSPAGSSTHRKVYHFVHQVANETQDVIRNHGQSVDQHIGAKLA